MERQRRPFVNETPEQRRQDLIDATLDLISEAGFRSATVRSIAQRANVTLGLIRHYFITKEDLINAAYQHHMTQMTTMALAHSAEGHLSPRARLAAVVRANLSPPVLTERNVMLWAAFLAEIAHESQIRETHDQVYLHFRARLEHLISDALVFEGRPVSKPAARRLATICTAIIDGLWLEGGASPQEFENTELADLALSGIGKILDLDLSEKGNRA